MFNPQPKKGMPPKKAKKAIKRTQIKKKFKKPTGEVNVFFEMIDEHGDEQLNCRCCNKTIYNLGPINFSHVVPKSIAPGLRLDKRNIWICCALCHTEWEFGDRNQDKFKEKNEQAEKLKQEYYGQGKTKG